MSEPKQCTRCHKTKPLSEFKMVFGKHVSGTCIDCVVALDRETKEIEYRKKGIRPIRVSYKYLENTDSANRSKPAEPATV